MGSLDWLPSLYFRKWVAIDNSRLYLVQMLSYVSIIGAVVYFLYSMPVYNVEVKPVFRSTKQITFPELTANLSNQTYCSGNLAGYNYWPDTASAWRFENAKCAEITSSFCSRNDTACVHRSALVHESVDEVFFATSFVEEIFNASSGQIGSESYLVPGIESYEASVAWAYQLDLPTSYFHMLFDMPLLESEQIKSVLVSSRDGSNLGSEDGRDGQTMSVARALDLAEVSLDDEVQGRLHAFPNNKDSAGSVRPKSRVTGIDIVVNVEVTNAFTDSDYNGPVAKVSLKAIPAWMGKQTVEFLDAQGSTRTRRFQGVRFLYRPRGTFSWFQINRVIYTLSLGLAWVQIPFFVVFYFAIYCLGSLSSVYTGFLYEDIDLHKEFNGVSGRMLGMSYGFHDIHDVEDVQNQVWGGSKERIQARMDLILEGSKELDGNERAQFTNFFFKHCASDLPSDTKAIQLEGYRQSYMTTENLLLEDIINMVDTDAANGNILEKLFMDESLKEYSATAENTVSRLLGKERKRTRLTFKETPHANLMSQVRRHKMLDVLASKSWLTRASYGQDIVQEQMDNLEHALRKMHETCDLVQPESTGDTVEEGEEQAGSAAGLPEDAKRENGTH